MKRLFVYLAVFFLFASDCFGFADIISVQGRLSDSSLRVLTGTYDFNFALYDGNGVGKNILWNESHSVSTSYGLWNVVLGTVNPVKLSSLDFNSPVWLQVIVEGEAQLPLVRFASNASAYVSKVALGAGDFNATCIPATNFFGNFVGTASGITFSSLILDNNAQFDARYCLLSDKNNASSLNSVVIASPPWATITSILPDTTCDTNAAGCSNYYNKTDVNVGWVPYTGATKDLNMGANSVLAWDMNTNVIMVSKMFASDGNIFIDYNADSFCLGGC